MQFRRTPTAAVILAAMLAACDSPVDVDDAVPVVESIAIDSAAGPLIRTATITLDRPGRITAVYSAANAPTLRLETADTATVHSLVLPRLRAGREYALHVRPANGPAGAPVTATFGTGPLPPEVAGLTFTTTGTPTHPVALVELVTSGSGFLGLLIVEDGEVVWYQRTNGSLFGTARRENGNLVLLDGALGLVEYRLDGSIAHRLPQPDSAPGAEYGRIHHDVIATPQNTLLFIANETRIVAGEDVTGEAVWEWEPEAGTVQKHWSVFDHFDWETERGPRSAPSNWLHGNGLAIGPDGNLLMSFRNLDQVVSISPDFQTLEWRMGGAGATLAMAAEDRFYGQHFPSATGTDRVLLFDNGAGRPEGTFSRAIEYRIDTAAGTATPIWEYRPDPDIFAQVVGSAHRLANGNTVILFGMSGGGLQATGPLVAVEVTAEGTERWRLAAGPAIGRLYRVTPLPSLLGESRVPDVSIQ